MGLDELVDILAALVERTFLRFVSTAFGLLSGHLPLQPTQLQLDVAATTVQIVSFLIGQPARFLQLFQSIFFISAPEPGQKVEKEKEEKIDDTAITTTQSDGYVSIFFFFQKKKKVDTRDALVLLVAQFLKKFSLGKICLKDGANVEIGDCVRLLLPAKVVVDGRRFRPKNLRPTNF